MKIILGAGDEKIDGYVTCDYDKLTNPDYCFDLEKDPFPFEDNSVNTVLAHHVLEHLGEGYFHCMKEIYRVCEHGAIIDIRVPHHRHDWFYNDPTHRRPITVDGLRLFSKKYNDLCKVEGAAASRLGYYLGIDFEVLEFNYSPMKEYISEFEGKPVEMVERYLSEHNNIIHEVHVILVAVKE